MKKKFSLHLDAILVLLVLFILMIGGLFFQQSQVSKLTSENELLQWQALEDSFNLSSQKNYIKKLEAQLAE
ncbi:hypothetical protein CW745_11455 [Psychromonas sp. psych-6C06]|uniref:hypothetical protein n=1 Tax=Psychromonas sp. psych-6C06 TaxID=2058089 RepID=UPI000C327799|nr:hypothetical protein [Psychromonas sp. psych-6C06]PKF61242.1 hypothetical protein CW745_11455 [Psychromonas sp. psych-6C06]